MAFRMAHASAVILPFRLARWRPRIAETTQNDHGSDLFHQARAVSNLPKLSNLAKSDKREGFQNRARRNFYTNTGILCTARL